MNVTAERAYPTPFANSTLFPLLLLSLASQKQAPKTKTTFKNEYDYVIVGGGSAGSVLAARLAEIPYVDVLLLEAGGPAPLVSDIPVAERALWSSDIDWKYRTVPQKSTGESLKNRQVVWPSGKTLGGCSVLGSTLAVRGSPQTYDEWSKMGAKGWSYKEVLPYFKKMEDNKNLEYVANGYHGVGGLQTIEKPIYIPEIRAAIFAHAKHEGIRIGDVNGPSQTGYYDPQGTIRHGQRCSTAKAYLVPSEDKQNLDIVSNAFVTKILFKNKEATGVQFDFQGRTFQVSAKLEVILSAGAINTPQLLMLSGIGPKEELDRLQIPVIADLPVGKGLQDHCGTPMFYLLSPKIKPLTEKLNDPANILLYISTKTGVLAAPTMVTVMPFLKTCDSEEKAGPDSELYLAEINIDLIKTLGLKKEIVDNYYGVLRDRAAYTCFSHSLQPKSKGKVTLKSCDPYDPPLIDPNYLDHPDDIQDLITAMKECNKIAKSDSLKTVGSTELPPFPKCEQYSGKEDAYLLCMAKQFVVTFNHQVGTAKMGDPKDPSTVVDPNLSVKKVKNLRVVDASVIPSLPSGNTNLPTMMVAEKAADIIKASIKCGEDGKAIKLPSIL